MVCNIFKQKNDHICSIRGRRSSIDISPDAKWYVKWWWNFRSCFTISRLNPRSKLFYRSPVDISKIKREHLRAHPRIVHPFSIFRLFYEMYLIVLFIAALLFAPVATAFGDFIRKQSFFYFVDVAVSTLCMLDIAMNFVTGYVIIKDEKVEMRPIKIAKHYLLSIQFYCDFLSAIPDIPHMANSYLLTRLIGCGKMLRISRLPTLVIYISRLSDVPVFKTMHTAVRVFQYIVVSYILLHWFACFVFLVPQWRWFIFGKLGQIGLHANSWIVTDELTGRRFFHYYIGSLYRATSYILCCEITNDRVTTTEDMMVAIFSFLFGKICLISMMVIILQLLLGQRSLSIKYQEKVSQVKAYMRQKQLPSSMQDRILTYYDYKFGGKFFKEDAITELLSNALKREINMYVCQGLVRNVALFANLPLRTLQDILAHLRVEIFLPNDLIIRAGTIGDCMYFLARGTVAVSTNTGKEVCHLDDGAVFGEISLVMKGRKRTANVLALEICEVYRLDKKDFKNIFDAHPALLKNLENVAHARMAATQQVEDSQRHIFYRQIF